MPIPIVLLGGAAVFYLFNEEPFASMRRVLAIRFAYKKQNPVTVRNCSIIFRRQVAYRRRCED